MDDMNTSLNLVAGGMVALALVSSAAAQESSPAQDEAVLANAAAASLSAQGQYNYNAAAADVQEENARSAALENSSRGLREWYARKQLNADYLAAKSRISQGMLNRLAEIKRPDRLTLGQYSRQAGKLNWPAVLMDPIFEEERIALDEAFAQRQAFDAGTDSHFFRAVNQLCKQLHEKMVNSIDQMSTTDSVRARKFLRSLEFEAKILPGDLGGLVTNGQ
jgi:hypothetical protein